MKKALFILGGALMLLQTQAIAQRLCGAQIRMNAIIAQHPEAAAKFAAQKAALQSDAATYKQYKLQMMSGAAERTTAAISPIPVIFHIIVDSAQFNQLGGTSGIVQRVDSQIAVLNRDYNRENSDSVNIPALWKPLYASTGIRFGSAHTDPSGYATPGYEILISSTAFYQGTSGTYGDAKHASSGGLDAWDVTKYMNVWCINFSDYSSLLGITSPKSDVTAGYEPADEEGICINYAALGKRSSPSDYYIATGYGSDYYDEGRTLTHEVGHFFEIWHPWGDDDGLCPWSSTSSCLSSGSVGPGGKGYDDGLADTPPEGDAQYGNPAYTISGGTYNDCCQNNGATNEQPIGIACLSFLDYTDDIAMHMFTTDQANAMASMVLIPPATGTGATGYGSLGESYSLTQNPGLLNYPPGTGVAQVAAGNSLDIFPNPATGVINITYDETKDQLQQVTVTNILGQEVQHINTAGQQKNYYSIDLSAMSKGIYFVRCNFASGSITRKIVLQ